MPDDVEYRFNTVEAATTGALEYLKPFWNDHSLLAIHNGVRVPDMPSNAVVTGSPGYRARIDAGLYDMGLEQLQAVHLQTERADRRPGEADRHQLRDSARSVGPRLLPDVVETPETIATKDARLAR